MTTRMIEIAVEVLIVCGIISALFYLWHKADDVNQNVSTVITETGDGIAESKYTKYNGITVSGADVINAIRANGDAIDVSVALITNEGNATPEDPKAYESSFVNLPSNADYINPNAKFTGEIVRNANNVITGLNFTQQEYAYAAKPGDGDGGGQVPGGGNDSNLGATLTGISDTLSSMATVLGNIQSSLANGGTGGSGGSGGTGSESENTIDLTEITSKLDNLETAVTGLNSALEDVRGDGIPTDDGQKYPTLTEIYSMVEDISNNTGSGSSGDSGNTESGSDPGVSEDTSKLAKIETDIGKIQTSLDSLNDLISNKILTGPDASDEEKSATIEGKVNSLQETIETLKSALEAMQTSIEEIKQNTGGTT